MGVQSLIRRLNPCIHPSLIRHLDLCIHQNLIHRLNPSIRLLRSLQIIMIIVSRRVVTQHPIRKSIQGQVILHPIRAFIRALVVALTIQHRIRAFIRVAIVITPISLMSQKPIQGGLIAMFILDHLRLVIVHTVVRMGEVKLHRVAIKPVIVVMP